MSDASIPPNNGHLNTYGAGFMHYMAAVATLVPRMTLEQLASVPAPQPAKPPKKPRQRREPRKSGLWTVVQAARLHGLTPPDAGQWVRLPPEYDAILALEPKPVALVVLEVLRKTIGTVEYDADGQSRHKEWARITQRHFARAGIMSNKLASQGIKQALEKGYILRRQVGPQAFEYAIRWRGAN
jgi:hypothetical protein